MNTQCCRIARLKCIHLELIQIVRGKRISGNVAHTQLLHVHCLYGRLYSVRHIRGYGHTPAALPEPPAQRNCAACVVRKLYPSISNNVVRPCRGFSFSSPSYIPSPSSPISNARSAPTKALRSIVTIVYQNIMRFLPEHNLHRLMVINPSPLTNVFCRVTFPTNFEMKVLQ